MYILWFNHFIIFWFCKPMSVSLWFDAIWKSYDLYYVELMPRYPERDLWICYINCLISEGFWVYLLTELCRIFNRNFSVRIIMISYRYPFSNGLRYEYALRVHARCFGKSRPTQRHATIATCSTSGSGRDTSWMLKSKNMIRKLNKTLK